MRITPSSSGGVAAALLAAGEAAGPGRPPAALRLGVDGAVATDRRLVADALDALLSAAARPVLRVSAEDFLRPRSVRLEAGPDDAGSGYERWYDDGALLREVLEPLAPGGSGLWLATLWDAQRDRATRAQRREAPAGAVLVLDGPFLLRWELSGAFDAVAHLATSPAAIARRSPAADAVRTTGAWARYLDETDPGPRAEVLVRAEDPARPALVG